MTDQVFRNHYHIKYLSDIVCKDEKIKRNPYIPSSFELVGGAVVDIMEHRKPKDFDFIGVSETIVKRFTKAGFRKICETKSAETYFNGVFTIQFLKKNLQGFDFTISQSRFNFKSQKLTFDKFAFENKQLVPPQFLDKSLLINSLRRIPHWKNKGYSINDKTYLSMLDAALGIQNLKS